MISFETLVSDSDILINSTTRNQSKKKRITFFREGEGSRLLFPHKTRDGKITLKK